jgi:phosphoribosylformylglycinamidine cyclo-ligase
VLPGNCDAVIDTGSWKVPAIFRHIGEGGGVDRTEMYQVFNMGIGMALVVAAIDAPRIISATKGRLIGRVERGSGGVQLKF